MSDLHLRQLERGARAGDPQAQVALWEEVRRADGFHDHGEQLDAHVASWYRTPSGMTPYCLSVAFKVETPSINGLLRGSLSDRRYTWPLTAAPGFASTNECQGEIARL